MYLSLVSLEGHLCLFAPVLHVCSSWRAFSEKLLVSTEVLFLDGRVKTHVTRAWVLMTPVPLVCLLTGDPKESGWEGDTSWLEGWVPTVCSALSKTFVGAVKGQSVLCGPEGLSCMGSRFSSLHTELWLYIVSFPWCPSEKALPL